MYIVRVRNIIVSQVNPHQEEMLYVYMDRILPLNAKAWIPFKTALCILKGFRRLSCMYGWIRAT